jgi:Protein of unknown function (DUF3152)
LNAFSKLQDRNGKSLRYALRALFVIGLSVLGFGLIPISATLAQLAPSRGNVELNITSEVPDVSQADFERQVLSVLNDPRGWTRAGFRFVSSASATFRVVLAVPKDVDRLCLPLKTGGEFSCQNGPIVALNADRYRKETADWDRSLDDYRAYVINHEVGHLFGQRHPTPRCPSSGGLSAVMEQQSKGLSGCKGNPWPLEWEIKLASQDVPRWAPTPDWDPAPKPKNLGGAGATIPIIGGESSTSTTSTSSVELVDTTAVDTVATDASEPTTITSPVSSVVGSEVPVDATGTALLDDTAGKSSPATKAKYSLSALLLLGLSVIGGVFLLVLFMPCRKRRRKSRRKSRRKAHSAREHVGKSASGDKDEPLAPSEVASRANHLRSSVSNAPQRTLLQSDERNRRLLGAGELTELYGDGLIGRRSNARTVFLLQADLQSDRSGDKQARADLSRLADSFERLLSELRTVTDEARCQAFAERAAEPVSSMKVRSCGIIIRSDDRLTMWLSGGAVGLALAADSIKCARARPEVRWIPLDGVSRVWLATENAEAEVQKLLADRATAGLSAELLKTIPQPSVSGPWAMFEL